MAAVVVAETSNSNLNLNSNSKDSPPTLPLHQDHRNTFQNLHPVMSSSSSSSLSSSYPITLKFMDVCYRVKMETNNKSRTSNLIRNMFTTNHSSGGGGGGPTSIDDVENSNQMERAILNGITGMVSPGEILAILGPSGSGKSTLLNALAGRLNQHHGRLTGTILANNKKQPTKQIARKTGFVTQDDVLYPCLTVRETLVFCSLLRLPNSMSKQEKISAAESVISELGLVKCENTMVGNGNGGGGGGVVSGGERKRVNIGHEMLINPSLLILDEPTSGLDSTAAYRLISTLGSLAKKGKTIVTSVHQPSSRVYQMFDSVLVLSEGNCLYFGKANQAMNYFDSIAFSPSFPMNPADFLLDLANGVCPIGNNKKDKHNVKQTLVSSYNNLLAPMVRSACMDTVPQTTPMVGINHTCREHRKRCNIGSIVFSWLNQFSILLERGIKVRRYESFDTMRVFQVITASLLVGILWWHSDYRNIQDRLGLLFSIAVFWGVLPATAATFSFPQERAIFMKERASGMYTLSSYFIAKIIGGIPMELILPTIFLTITYWMAGLKPELGAFLLTLIVILGYVLVSQGLGLAFGALIMDAKQASTIVTVTMLASVLIGGFYVHNVPPSIAWMKYLSSTFYSYRLLISVQYGDGREISALMGCSSMSSSSRHRPDLVSSCKFIEEDIQGQMHPIFCSGIMLLMFVGYRIIAYLALRCRRY